MLSLYRLATIIGYPFIELYFRSRLVNGKEDLIRFPERKGITIKARPSGPILWFHAASVGESLSLLPLISSLLTRHGNINILVTTGTVSSASVMAERLPQRAFHQYVPIDLIICVRRFLDHWKPTMALWAESEFWPNLISETHARGIPMALINGRVSERSFRSWKVFRSVIRNLIGKFDLCLGQTSQDAARLLSLGAKNCKCLGNLKFASQPLPVDENQLSDLEHAVKDRPRFFAASTHEGEEKIIAETHLKIKQTHPTFITIIAPRHPNRAKKIYLMLKNRLGLKVARRSINEPIAPNTDIYLVDTFGELGLFFHLSEVVFIGKSLVNLGGQNPLEAIRLGCAVVHGPYMTNFQQITDEMSQLNCSFLVKNNKELAQTLELLFSDDALRSSMILNGKKFLELHSKVVEEITEEIVGLLESADGHP